ncbi:hypothetical protein P153DRAFT_394487 [Dothidotthia symphoricarpi CBS 119687]|uniref:Vacuolar protein sorting-associated protein 62 n=1 Tax=Dothidotthia symphoricarpi CBS 119687 TaxID=1392245 RepID=A0A6A6AMD9_9PLEO|nr:uncharacterized protein P153DRAFT_394487 [Dothidotthia symphoricarpi CBS 119687]KAF2132333.1 hypothetical protein P153DRAFT_394487 [Dothidotthia symphoricarpi CBS 119687]
MFPQLALAVIALVASVICAPTNLHDRQAPSDVPDYVMKYAPILFLHSTDPYLPTDFQLFLNNTTPRVNFAAVPGPSNPLTLSNLDQVSADAYLTSNDDVTKNPSWIKGTKPDASGKTNNAITASVIVNDKGNGVVDAFYMYFYAYNYGGEVLGWKALNFGNHVGDWEHTMVRFTNGLPTAIWYSQHANGEAFTYAAVEKIGLRPVVYVASGSHANYAIPGIHSHVIPNLNLPGGVLQDYTDRGVMWDPLLAAWFYKYDAGTSAFEAFGGEAPVAWLGFRGHWGDMEYPTSDKRQVKLFGQAKFGSGPTGPVDKQLNRSKICPENGILCIVRSILAP